MVILMWRGDDAVIVPRSIVVGDIAINANSMS